MASLQAGRAGQYQGSPARARFQKKPSHRLRSEAKVSVICRCAIIRRGSSRIVQFCRRRGLGRLNILQRQPRRLKALSPRVTFEIERLSTKSRRGGRFWGATNWGLHHLRATAFADVAIALVFGLKTGRNASSLKV